MKKLLFLLILLPFLASGQVRNLEAQYPISDPSKENLRDGILADGNSKRIPIKTTSTKL
jgi:hypothetical protein